MSACIYVSYYTPDYEEVAHRLKLSLATFELEHIVVPVPDRGTWVANCARKPLFIRDLLSQMKKPLVWIDADAVVVKRPALFEDSAYCHDAAVCRYTWHQGKRETLSGTVWFNDTYMAKRMVEHWIEQQALLPDMWDQVGLQMAVAEAEKTSAVIENLPVEYCYIHDLHRREHPDADPVIVHYQHSRQTRHKKVSP